MIPMNRCSEGVIRDAISCGDIMADVPEVRDIRWCGLRWQ